VSFILPQKEVELIVQRRAFGHQFFQLRDHREWIPPRDVLETSHIEHRHDRTRAIEPRGGFAKPFGPHLRLEHRHGGRIRLPPSVMLGDVINPRRGERRSDVHFELHPAPVVVVVQLGRQTVREQIQPRLRETAMAVMKFGIVFDARAEVVDLAVDLHSQSTPRITVATSIAKEDPDVRLGIPLAGVVSQFAHAPIGQGRFADPVILIDHRKAQWSIGQLIQQSTHYPPRIVKER